MILWLFLTYGITLVITGSKIFRIFREWDATGLLKCPMCTGWWVGLALSLYSLGPASGQVWHTEMPQILLTMLANAFSASAWCWIVHVVLVRLGADKL